MTVEHPGWLCDFDGTLYCARPVKLSMTAELLFTGLAHLGTIKAFREEHEALREEGGEYAPSPFAEQLERTARRVGKSPDEVEAVVRRFMQEKPGKWIRRHARHELIAELRAHRAAGGKAAVVSDYPVLAKLSSLGIADLFDAVVANGEPGGPARLKPAPDGFLAAARGLALEPRECLVLGDRDDADGEAARRAGMAFRLVGS